VPEAGYELLPLRTAGLPRRPSLQGARATISAFRAPFAARRLLREQRPDVVMGGGGYVGGPLVLAARLLGIPAVLTEADAHFGLANRLAAPFATKALLAYPIEGRDGEKYRVVGRPIPARSQAGIDRGAARRAFGLPEDGEVVLVVGGSLGARALNEAVLEAFAAEGPAILHLCGERDYSDLAPRVTRSDYKLLAFTDSFGTALAAADMVVSRSGGAVWELAAAGVPALLVPYPHATANHQYKNARHFEAGGGARVVRQAELKVREDVMQLLADGAVLERMRAAMLHLARPRAADDVAEVVIALASAGR
ncbi:MAG: UDP-N-acetylglucosamine--N-acetylmuramyl-(pentapeptide) pyrophosphoryl-undecaprenol N-acetylglucosamine transferase, partial [Gaiellaceae bacterium]